MAYRDDARTNPPNATLDRHAAINQPFFDGPEGNSESQTSLKVAVMMPTASGSRCNRAEA
jgi:hypothetical protein